MGIKEELIFDFSINMPRLLVSGNTGIIDNIKKIVLISDKNIIVDHGSQYSSIIGMDLVVKELGEERLTVTGKIQSIEFYYESKDQSHEK
ncbi:MAG: YabP/YqfC family sporulation protein [Anaerovoracaceae bacterium]